MDIGAAGDGLADGAKRVVTLESKEGQRFELLFEAAIQSELLRDTLQVQDEPDEDADETPSVDAPLRLERVNGACLKKIVDFLKYHHTTPLKEIEHPLPADTFDLVRLLQFRLA
jgi:hypothetical protein